MKSLEELTAEVREKIKDLKIEDVERQLDIIEFMLGSSEILEIAGGKTKEGQLGARTALVLTYKELLARLNNKNS